jgi:hypothetical protein
MKTRLRFFIISFCCIVQISAQEPPKVKYGKITDEEINLKTYLPDTTANAVILFDKGESDVSYDLSKGQFALHFDRFVRIKILKQEGTSWGNFLIPLYSNNSTREEVRGIDGVTYNLEGGNLEKAELKKESIFHERENKYWEVVKLSMPKVKVGSVIDLRYSISSPLIWNLRTWKFQYTIPVKWSQYEVKYPEFFNYHQSSLGYQRLNSYTQTTTNETQPISYRAYVYNYTSKEVPAMKDEPYITTLENYTTRIKFELASTDFIKIGGMYKDYTNSWKTITEELLQDADFGGQIKSDNFAGEITEKLIAGKSTEMEKTSAIYNHIQHSMKWDKSESYSPSKSLKKAYNDKNGNSADINLILLVMLRKAGLTADPVLLSTRSNGMLTPTSPSINDLNYLIIQAIIDGNPILLDATEPNLPAGLIPFRCLNWNGILIKKDASKEIPLTNTGSRSNNSVFMELSDGKFVGNMNLKTIGLSAFNFREEVKDAGGAKDYFEKLKNNSSDIQYLDYSFANLDSINLPMDRTYKFSIDNPVENEDSILYVNPILIDRLQKNPFTSPKREYPVDFGTSFFSNYILIFKIPEGYKVDELPENKSFALDEKAASYAYLAGQADGQITLNTRFKIDKSLFLPSEYENLKAFYDLVVAKESEQIILKKIR